MVSPEGLKKLSALLRSFGLDVNTRLTDALWVRPPGLIGDAPAGPPFDGDGLAGDGAGPVGHQE